MADYCQFPPRGLTYFWFLNDHLDLARLRRQMRAFADGGAAAVVLHARDGLLIPYLSADWFELMRLLAGELAELGIQSWLYDENYCPSGQADGWVVHHHPEFVGRRIERFEAPADLAEGDLFCGPPGELLWAGIVDPGGVAPPLALTDRVGTIRRHWEVSESWDSRWYYPSTPLYSCARSAAYVSEFALRRPALPAGRRLVMFVARPCGRDSHWGALVDSLNPAATAAFIRYTYDRYADAMGPMLGREVTAIFTDEPKMHDAHAYTPGMWQPFSERYGYDLRPRLEHLFSDSATPEIMRTRLDYRQWIADRFCDCWLDPIASWCRDHRLHLVGHISPEDDPVQQAACVGNLFPLLGKFSMPGLDIIIPAVGDARHPLLNIGVTSANSCSQQQGRGGVVSEVLGASGQEMTPETGGRVLAWQILSGVSTPVIHAAFHSSLGMRQFDAPPDCGPDSPRWPAMRVMGPQLQPFIETVAEATQIAPVAIVWPIRSFICAKMGEYHGDYPLRNGLSDLLLACLSAQVGVQLLDERDLQAAELDGRRLRLGKASYSHILVPPATVLHRATLARLGACCAAGIEVTRCDDSLRWVDDDTTVTPLTPAAIPGEQADIDAAWCEANLPRLAPVTGCGLRKLRASQWQRDGLVTTLLMNLDELPCPVAEGITLAAGEMVAMGEREGAWQTVARFDPAALPAMLPPPPSLALRDWQYQFDQEPWQTVASPLAAYRWRLPPIGTTEPIQMVLTLVGARDGAAVAQRLAYRATVTTTEQLASRAVLVLEPTTARGNFCVRLGEHSWQATVNDLDHDATELDLTAALQPGDNCLTIEVLQPQPNDGLHSAPVIRLRPMA